RAADKRRRLTTNLNSLNTMLLGGLWHGASLNFVIWGGLNGAGVIIYKTWKNWSPLTRTLVMLLLFVAVYLSGTYIYPCAALNIAKIWIGLLCIGTLVRYMYHLFQTLSDKSLSLSVEAALSKVWGIAQTFVFITFTRLFFRSGSNLDPAEANRVAWETAVNMIEQIGGAWDVEIIPQVIQSYAAVFVLFILGMIIHWLPQNWKRRYRLAFAKLPIACMVLVVVAVVFFVYQFITADLQAFIYFQF
ncbi:MAG: MBOAT family protein, partial [Bacteroidales bacterium]|nr:MBOAT family protein [Bacteroidales bacterium]